MTPIQLLESVKARFHTLMHDEQPALEALLRQSLVAYQDLAGVIKRHRYQEPAETYQLPQNFLARVGVSDAENQFVGSTVWPDDGEIELELTGREAWPLTLTYVLSLATVDLETFELPPTAVGIISDHLEALITIPNTERIRRVSVAGKIDVSDLPMQNDLVERKRLIEENMKASRAILSPFSVMG